MSYDFCEGARVSPAQASSAWVRPRGGLSIEVRSEGVALCARAKMTSGTKATLGQSISLLLRLTSLHVC
jgi:hypothetical protein